MEKIADILRIPDIDILYKDTYIKTLYVSKEEDKIMSFWGVVGAIIVAVLILCIL